MIDFDYLSQNIENQKEFFLRGHTRSLGFRRQQLTTMWHLVKDNESRILGALAADLKKPPFEAFTAEVGFILDEIKYTIKNLKKWARPLRVATPLLFKLSQGRVYRVPYGQVLVFGPWNYPFQSLMSPVIAALAAGNVVVLKPSEDAPATGQLIMELVQDKFSKELVYVVLGGIDIGKNLLERRFDYIFFTGSPRVGQIVMEKASKHLTPVTLELGGKSPCIVEKSANLEVAARRIIWGKFFNIGQTCVAPDYLLVQDEIAERLISYMQKILIEFYGEDPQKSPDLARIVSKKHYQRLKSYLLEGDIITGGEFDDADLYIAPTLMKNIKVDARLMQEEIFGPILPILTFKNIEHIFEIIGYNPNPLALYLFCKDREIEKLIIERISYGGGCINDTFIHLSVPELPFGGIGASGMGSYHGRKGFETFSHAKSIMKSPTWFDPNLRYAPYKGKLSLIKKLIGK